MLGAEHVRARQREGRLELLALKGKARLRALDLAQRFVAIAAAHEGRARGEFEQACAAVPIGVRDKRLAAGLRKLVEDRCEFDMPADQSPADLRAAVFDRAAAARRALEPGVAFDRVAVLASVAAELGLDPSDVEERLYADLRAAHRMVAFNPTTPERLLADYDLAQAQAALLRATRVTAVVRCGSPSTYRRLFRQLKFHRLLHRIEEVDGGYRIEIDGPLSVFGPSTKYGLQLALAFRYLRECDRWSLDAELRWGKARRRLTLHLEGGATSPEETNAVRLPEEVEKLRERFAQRRSPWKVDACNQILSLPGVGVCVPDLEFVHQDRGRRVFLEVLGYWSRDAVWKRVEFVEQGLSEPVLFAVPSRLRVSEEILDPGASSALYVYKGVLSPKAVEERLEDLGG